MRAAREDRLRNHGICTRGTNPSCPLRVWDTSLLVPVALAGPRRFQCHHKSAILPRLDDR